MKPYVLVSGDFVRTGGMDRANLALACYLARRGDEVHLVAHRVATDLLERPNLRHHRVPKLVGSYFLSGPLLDRVGRRWGRRALARGGRVVVNGGNCNFGDVNWVHYVHAAFRPRPRGTAWGRLKDAWRQRAYRNQEARSLRGARLVITNSERTRVDLLERVGLPPERVHTVYYGISPELFRPARPEERAALRRRLGWPEETPVVAFVGGAGDARKGFDTLFTAWQQVCARPSWDARLAVIGSEVGLTAWRERAAAAGIADRIDFLGFRTDVPDLLRACDALASPTRYEAYGLGVHEALCCGLAAIVSRSAGVAERYPEDLGPLLLDDPEDAAALAQALLGWRERRAAYAASTAALAERLRAYTWDDMAGRIAALMDGNA
jgi:glycosyltransferase involved in cell wall biosynthesis